jgi:hypothetical protein
MRAMARAALLIFAVTLMLTGCGSSEPDFTDYTEAEVREYCQLQYRLQHRVAQRAPVAVYSEADAFERFLGCIRRGEELSEQY